MPFRHLVGFLIRGAESYFACYGVSPPWVILTCYTHSSTCNCKYSIRVSHIHTEKLGAPGQSINLLIGKTKLLIGKTSFLRKLCCHGPGETCWFVSALFCLARTIEPLRAYEFNYMRQRVRNTKKNIHDPPPPHPDRVSVFEQSAPGAHKPRVWSVVISRFPYKIRKVTSYNYVF